MEPRAAIDWRDDARRIAANIAKLPELSVSDYAQFALILRTSVSFQHYGRRHSVRCLLGRHDKGTTSMKKLSLTMAAVLALLSIAGCAQYVGKGKAPPPVVTKG